MRQNWNFGSGAHIALQNKEKLAHPTRGAARHQKPAYLLNNFSACRAD
jgi:hypothetical protein